MIKWNEEWPQIQDWSVRRNVDPLFMAAIRASENGGPGRELGVLGVGADTYDAQLRVATRTIAGRLTEYNEGPIFVLVDAMGFKRACYGAGFIRYVQQSWAPLGVANDPHGTNANWFGNVSAHYQAFIAVGHPA